MVARAVCARTSAQRWVWPLDLAQYDRSGELSVAEKRTVTRDLPRALATQRSHRRALWGLGGIDRLRKPLLDALMAIDADSRHADRVILMILRCCATLGTAFWAWDAATWQRVLGTTQRKFYAAHRPVPAHGSERQMLIAVAYLLRCFNDIPALGEVQRVSLAEKVFGKERIAASLKRVDAVASGWGYRAHSKPLMSVVAELYLINQKPELEALSVDIVEATRRRWEDSNYRSSLYFQLCRILASMGIGPTQPAIRNRTPVGQLRTARNAAVPAAWIAAVERWESTSALTRASRGHVRDAILKAGRWVAREHPGFEEPNQWTRELAAEYVAAVDRMVVGDYVARTAGLRATLGQPVKARSKDFFLAAMRRFFGDLQEWEWIHRRFDPVRAFATPRPVKALIGPSPRTIADDLWAKLLWAGLNLAASDLPGHGGVCDGDMTDRQTTRRAGSYYPLELLQALSVVWLFAGLRSDEIVRLRIGCARREITLLSTPEAHERCWMLDVPIHKTGTAFAKPIDPIVGEAISKWEAVRPKQPLHLDQKTGELVDLLFAYRARPVPRAYLNRRLIPVLCKKAGIPRSDARGRISSHRARSTIASQLFNAREPMTLFELQAWLGHRSPATTQHYVAFTPTRLARSYTDAQYFQRNLRMMHVLVDQQAIKHDVARTGEPWRYYDLGHGLCSYEFFDRCPHRMACARCDFYLPKDSSRADLLASKEGMLRMIQEIPLTDDERAAVDGDLEALDRLLKRLAATPTPDRAPLHEP